MGDAAAGLSTQHLASAESPEPLFVNDFAGVKFETPPPACRRAETAGKGKFVNVASQCQICGLAVHKHSHDTCTVAYIVDTTGSIQFTTVPALQHLLSELQVLTSLHRTKCADTSPTHIVQICNDGMAVSLLDFTDSHGSHAAS